MQRFRGTRTPTTDFAAVASDLQTTPLFVDVDLTNLRSLAAGTALELPINGNVLYIDQKAGSGFATLHFNDDARAGNTPFTVFPGFVARVPYIKVLIENEPQPGMVMRFIYGVDLDFTPAVSAGVFGEVSVVDGAKSRSLAGAAFYGGQGASAGPALYPTIQLWNPAASGFNLIVEQLWVSLQDTVPGNLVFAHNAVALAGGGAAAFSKNLGAAASAGFIRYENLAVFPSATSFSFMYTNPGDVIPFSFREPIVVAPGVGMLVLGPVNTGCYVNFEFFQEGI